MEELVIVFHLMGLLFVLRGWFLAGMVLVGVSLTSALPDARAQGMDMLSRIALDTTPINETFTVQAIKGNFQNENPFLLTLWKKAVGVQNRRNQSSYRLIWKITLTPTQAGKGVIVLNSDLTLESDFMMGIYNAERPGPLQQVFAIGAKLVTSADTSNNPPLPPRVYDIFAFDELSFPYRIPLAFCRLRNCSDLAEDLPTPPPITTTTTTTTKAPVDGDGGKSLPVYGTDIESILRSTEFMIGMIAWNIILTVLIFILICIIMCIVADVEKRRKREGKPIVNNMEVASDSIEEPTHYHNSGYDTLDDKEEASRYSTNGDDKI